MSSNSRTVYALETILVSIGAIECYSSDYDTADDYYHDSKSFDAAMIHFVNIGEMIDRIDTVTKSRYSTIPWQDIKDFRNIVAHNYFGIDAEEIWDIIHNHLPLLKHNIKNILLAQE